MFGGSTYNRERDGGRLFVQLLAVYDLMMDGDWRTLEAIERALCSRYPQASISARLRDFRKEKFGSHVVTRRYVGDGLWEYRLDPTSGAFDLTKRFGQGIQDAA